MIDGKLIKDGASWRFRATCPLCGKPAEVRGIRKSAYDWWRRGAFVQVAFPDLTAGEREILVSGTHGGCFDAAFPEEDEDDPPRRGNPLDSF